MAYENIMIRQETGRCLLCHEAPCSQACPKNLPVADIIRSLRFENMSGAVRKIGTSNSCADCGAPCMDVCNRKKLGGSIDIPKIIDMCLGEKLAYATVPTAAEALSKTVNITANIMEKTIEDITENSQPDLSVEFCGVKFENPFLLSSSVVCSNYEMIAKAFDMGWAGVAFKTIGNFVPEEVSPRFATLEKEDNPFVGFKNIEQISDHTLQENIDFIKRLKKEYPSKVIIASIMGRDEEEWTYLASKMEEAGADMIECNFSCPHMSGDGLGSDVGTLPELVATYTAATRAGTTLPVLAKMTPNITNMELPAVAAVKAGADGIAAINTIKSVMNVDLNSFVSEPNVAGRSSVGGYSGKAVKPIALRFIVDMKSNEKLAQVPISGMGGIETWKDAAEFISLGCGTVQVTTAVMQYGYRIIDDLIEGLSFYMKERQVSHVADIIGKALPSIYPTDQLDRKTIQFPKFNRQLCVGCQRCYLSCYDGGHQALRMDPKTNTPIMDPKKCVGCQLCKLVCPAGAITAGVRK